MDKRDDPGFLTSTCPGVVSCAAFLVWAGGRRGPDRSAGASRDACRMKSREASAPAGSRNPASAGSLVVVGLPPPARTSHPADAGGGGLGRFHERRRGHKRGRRRLATPHEVTSRGVGTTAAPGVVSLRPPGAVLCPSNTSTPSERCQEWRPPGCQPIRPGGCHSTFDDRPLDPCNTRSCADWVALLPGVPAGC